MSLLVDIKKDFGRFRLDAHFEAESGAVTGLLGASGCGKSVTLKCVAGIEKPDEGRIVLDGRVLFDSEKRIDLTPQQRRVGYLRAARGSTRGSSRAGSSSGLRWRGYWRASRRC